MFCDEGAEEVEEVGLHGEEVWGCGFLLLVALLLLFRGLAIGVFGGRAVEGGWGLFDGRVGGEEEGFSLWGGLFKHVLVEDVHVSSEDGIHPVTTFSIPASPIFSTF